MVKYFSWLTISILFLGGSPTQAAERTISQLPAPSLRAENSGNLAAPDIPAILAIEDKGKRVAELQHAIEYYENLHRSNPENVPALQQLGNLYGWVNKFDLSINAYQAAIKKDPHNSSLKIDLARIYRWAQRLADAEMLYKTVLATYPNNPHALKGLAVTYLKQGNYPDAEKVLERALRTHPDDAELYKEQGVLFAWQERYNEATVSLEKAIELSPEMSDAIITLGDVYYWNKQYPQALDEYRKASSLAPDSADLSLMIAKTYRALNNLTMAEEFASNVMRLNPVNSEAKELLSAISRDKHLINWETGVHYLELISMLFVLTLISIGYKRNRRMLKRRHPVVSASIPLLLLVAALLSIASFVAETAVKSFYDVEFVESVASSLTLILLGIIYLAQLLYAGRNSTKSQNKVVLAIGAHPDDIELGCGGYILRAKAEGAKVYGLTLTKGERGTEIANVREKEAHSAAKFMELDGYWILDFPDTHLQENVGIIREKLEEIIKQISPTEVLVHNQYDHHADHRAAFNAAKEAARMIPTLLCYETVSTPTEYKADYFVDITDHLAEMLHAISLHKSQKHKSYMDTELLKGRAAHRGIQCGMPYAMAFQVYRIVN